MNRCTLINSCCRQTDRHTDTQTDTQTETHTDRQTDTQTDRQTDRHTDRQADRQTDRQRQLTHTDTQTATAHTQADRQRQLTHTCRPHRPGDSQHALQLTYILQLSRIPRTSSVTRACACDQTWVWTNNQYIVIQLSLYS